MLSDIKEQFRDDVSDAYSRAREELNEKYAGENVVASFGKWSRRGGAKRTAHEEFTVAEVHVVDGGKRGERFVVELDVEGSTETYHDPEEVTVV